MSDREEIVYLAAAVATGMLFRYSDAPAYDLSVLNNRQQLARRAILTAEMMWLEIERAEVWLKDQPREKPVT